MWGLFSGSKSSKPPAQEEAPASPPHQQQQQQQQQSLPQQQQHYYPTAAATQHQQAAVAPQRQQQQYFNPNAANGFGAAGVGGGGGYADVNSTTLPPRRGDASVQQQQQTREQLQQQQQQLHFQKHLAATFIAPSDSTKTKVHIATEYTNRYYTHYLITNGGRPPPSDDDEETSSESASAAFINDHTRARQRKMSAERDFNLIEIIGCGAFGEVYLCTLKSDPMQTLLVMKKLRKTITMCRKQVLNVRAERDILVAARSDNGGGGAMGMGQAQVQAATQRLQQQRRAAASAAAAAALAPTSTTAPLPLPSLRLEDWAVDIYYSFQDAEHLYFVLEYCAGGDLMTWLMDIDIFPEHIARFYTAEIALAIEALHRKGYAHRDVKPDNILIDACGHVKITDFGLAKHVGGGSGANGLGDEDDEAADEDDNGEDDDDDDDTGGAEKSTLAAAADNGTATNNCGRRMTKEERLAARRAEKEAKQQRAWDAAMNGDDGSPLSVAPAQQQRAALSAPAAGGSAGATDVGAGGGRRRIERSRGQFFTAVGSPGYMAPEVVIAKPSVRQLLRIDPSLPVVPYSDACDWWSLGIVLYEMLYGYVPFHADEEGSVQAKICRWDRFLEFPGHDPAAREPPPPVLPSAAAVDLMRRLLCAEADRITFDEMLSHPFFAGVNWETIRSERPRPIVGPDPARPSERVVTGYEAPPFVLQLRSPTDTRYFDIAGVRHQQREQQKLHEQYKAAYSQRLEHLKRQQQVQKQKLESAAAAASASHSVAKSIAAAQQQQQQSQSSSGGMNESANNTNSSGSPYDKSDLNELQAHHAVLSARQHAAIEDLLQHQRSSQGDDVYQPSDARYLFYGFTAKFGVGPKGGGGANGGGSDGPQTRSARREQDMRDVMTGGAGTAKGAAKMSRPALNQDFDEDDD